MRYAWIRPGGLGDILATCNLLRNFKDKYGEKSHVSYGVAGGVGKIIGPFLRDFGFDEIIESSMAGLKQKFDGREFHLLGYPVELRRSEYPNLKPTSRHPYEPMVQHVLDGWAEELEIEPDTTSFRLKLPIPLNGLSGDYITIHPWALWSPYKNWSGEKWNELCFRLSAKNIKTVQIGAATDIQIPNATGRIKLENPRLQFESCLMAMARARLHVGVDSWSNHATNIWWRGRGRVKGVILWGSSSLIGTGYYTNRNIIKNLPCQPCFKEDPAVSPIPLSRCTRPMNQTYQNPKHECMAQISVDDVFSAIIEEFELARQVKIT